MTRTRLSLVAAIGLVLSLTLAACAPAKLDITDVTGIIDVRSAEDFATSHIVGSQSFPYNPSDFILSVTVFSKTGKYYVYGTNDAEVSQAITDMFGLGFTNVTNLGDFENAQRILPLGVTK